VARMARWCFQHRRIVVGGWLLALVAFVAVSAGAGSSFNTDLSLPNTDSQSALDLLTTNFAAASGEGDQVVIQTSHGATVSSPAVRTAVSAALAKVQNVPGVASVASPYAPAGSSQISRDDTVAFARVSWDKLAAKVTKVDAQNLIAAAQSANGQNIAVSLSGQSITNSERTGLGKSVVVGILAALAVLLLVFGGAILASLMPLATAILALAIGASSIGLLSHSFNIASASTQLAILIGLGVGVDYGLFIISRHRAGVKAGLSYEAAAAQALKTSGRTVLFAGLTVCIALLGQLTLGVGFLDGLAVSSALAVALTMVTSLTFLPAMLGFLGPKVLSKRERRALTSDQPAAAAIGLSVRWARFVEAHKGLVATAGLIAIVGIALPIGGLRLGTSVANTDPPSWTTHQAYVALAQGFGPGFNAPFELAGEVNGPADAAAFSHLLAVAAQTPGVASVTPAVTSPNGQVELATLYPTTSPQDQQTVDLVSTLRHQLIPQAEQGTKLVVHVGGVTPTNIDFAHVLAQKLPLFIAVVVLLAFLLLVGVFRSLLVPAIASVMNLLSIGAGLGAVNAVFNWGWGASVLGVSGRGPVEAFFPVVMFAVLFGLSMDYQVYLVSRIQEEWHRRLRSDSGGLARLGRRAASRNHDAVTAGQANSGRIITAAAGIMVLVFASFTLSDHRLLQEFGFGLGFSVLIDALIIRSMVVPALMHAAGPANWALPAWLERMLPRLDLDPSYANSSQPDAGQIAASSGVQGDGELSYGRDRT
jgi:putative drug exporter of the RND superfamily